MEEVKDAFNFIARDMCHGKHQNLYDDSAKDDKNHGMWIPKLEYTVEFDPGEPEPEEEDEEGME